MGSRIVERLISERDARYSNGIYVATQLQFAWNSNHMEGSTLTPKQTAQIFNTGTFTMDGTERVSVDDAIETRNHFIAFRWILDHADEPVDKDLVCHLHAILKNGTRQADEPVYNVGGYKTEPNIIGDMSAPACVALPEDVPQTMDRLFDIYAHLEDDPYQIARAHWMFEKIHPFSDGNGRVGRLVMFKELLRIDALPAIIHDSLHDRYTHNMSKFPEEPGWLVDLILFERDLYRSKVLDRVRADVDYTYNDRWSESDHTIQLREDTEFKNALEARSKSTVDQLQEDMDDLLWGGPANLPYPTAEQAPRTGTDTTGNGIEP